MSLARDRRIRELLDEARAVPATDRPAVLASLEPDTELITEALDLLTAEGDASSTDTPLVDLRSPRFVSPSDDEVPDVPGYDVQSLLGEGGMGRVFVAVQQSADRRQVAIKMIRPMLVGSDLMRRFDAEREALSRLNHPAIAQLYAAGNASDGRPFVAMEYVEGLPITRYCDRNRLGIRERLELFAAVCRGVEHAHRRQLLHRDLKPSNLLVATRDGEPTPKIIDFGIARALDTPDDGTLVTGPGLLGTPAYMSPEALEPSDDGDGQRDLDTRTDVYSLGVVLYELLLGVHPHGDSAKTPFSVMRSILEEEPRRPSTRWRTLDQDTQTVAARRRRASRDEVRRALDSDLDWVTMKAIARDRERRYGSVGALVADVERFLRHEPIEARPPTLSYRLSCLARRHRAAAIATGLALLFLVLGTVGATIGMLRAREAETQARAEARRANREAETTSRVTDVLVDLFVVADPSKGGPSTTMEVGELLDRGTERIRDDLEEDPAIQARLMSVLGNIYRVVGAFDTSRELLERALELWELDPQPDPYRLGQTLNHLAVLDRKLSRYGDAEARLQRALVLWESALGPAHPKIGGLLNNLGNLQRELGRYEESAESLARALAIWEGEHGPDHRDVGIAALNLGNVWNQLQRHEDALTLYRRAGGIFEALLGPDHPHLGVVYYNIADLTSEIGSYDEAEAAIRTCLRIREAAFGADHVASAEALRLLGAILLRDGRIEEAEPRLVDALGMFERIVGPDHVNVAIALVDLSILRRQQGKAAEALNLAERAIAILEALVTEGELALQQAREAARAARDDLAGVPAVDS